MPLLDIHYLSGVLGAPPVCGVALSRIDSSRVIPARGHLVPMLRLSCVWYRFGQQAAVYVLSLATLTAPTYGASNSTGIPKHLPETARQMAEQARQWRADALLMRVEVGRKEGQQSAFETEALFYFLSPSEHLIIRLPDRLEVAAQQLLPDQVGVRGSFIPIPDFTVDLTQALGVAKRAGMSGEMQAADLAVRTPSGRLPVLAWRIQSRLGDDPLYYVDALTAAHLTSRQVSNPVAGPDPTLQASEDALRAALRRSALIPPGNTTPWMEFVVKPLLEARDVFECNARGGGWTIVRVCMP